MKKIGLLVALASVLFSGAAHAVGANDLRLMMRNNINSVNLNIDLPNPNVGSIIGYDPNSTWGRLDGGTGAFQVFLLGTGLNYDSPSSTISVVGFFPTPTGTTLQYIRGDGSLATLPGPGAATFQYPSRALNSCFQISSTKDADFHYKIDVTGSLSLTSGTTGTVTATAYTNSGCTTGAQPVADGQSAQSGSLVIGLGISQTASVSLDGTLPAGEWVKLTTANTVGTPTFAIRTVQTERISP